MQVTKSLHALDDVQVVITFVQEVPMHEVQSEGGVVDRSVMGHTAAQLDAQAPEPHAHDVRASM